jgi:predicted nuclease of predicted toxin-antitoxin system
MPRTIRFHLDENCHHGIAVALRRHGVDVTTAPEAELLGVTDEEQLRFAVGQGRAIFTQDKDFLKLAGQGVEHDGILYCRQKPGPWVTLSEASFSFGRFTSRMS